MACVLMTHAQLTQRTQNWWGLTRTAASRTLVSHILGVITLSMSSEHTNLFFFLHTDKAVIISQKSIGLLFLFTLQAHHSWSTAQLMLASMVGQKYLGLTAPSLPHFCRSHVHIPLTVALAPGQHLEHSRFSISIRWMVADAWRSNQPTWDLVLTTY